MGKRREKHPFEDNPFVEGLLEWMGSPEGQRSIEVGDALWQILDGLQLDAARRLFLWPEGQRLSFAQSIERIHKENSHFPRQRIASFLISWVGNYAPEHYSQTQLARA